MSELRKGVLLAAAAYTCWGLFPLYWVLLRPADAAEILAHRIVWSLVVAALLVARLRGSSWLRGMAAKQLRFLAFAALLLSINWATYIWAVHHQHVVEVALGYFINPLVSVLLGVFFFGERLRRAQWVALGIAAAAVVVLSVEYGRLPWIALTLASTFALYGFVKKKAGAGAVESLAVETGLLFLPALGYLLFLEHGGQATFGHLSRGKDVLLGACGILTAIPLVWFAAAANRVPLTTIGLLQYITPSLQFFCGVVVMREAMPAHRWLGFGLVWAGLAIYAVESIVHHELEIGRAITESTGDC